MSVLGPSLPRAHGGASLPNCLSLPWAHLSQGLIEAHPCREPIPTSGPYMPTDDGGPRIPKAILPEGPGGPCMPRVYPCREHILAQGISIPSVHGGLFMPRVHACLEPILSQGQFITRAPSGLMHTEGSSLPRAYPLRGPMGAYPCRGTIPAQGPSIPKTLLGPSMPRGTHPGDSWGLIPAQSRSIPRAHGGPSIPWTHPC